MSDPVDEHLDKALASLDDLTVRELEVTAEALASRRHPLHAFSSVFRDVADARTGGWKADIARFHLSESVSRADDALAERIADAPAPFWLHVRDALHAERVRHAADRNAKTLERVRLVRRVTRRLDVTLSAAIVSLTDRLIHLLTPLLTLEQRSHRPRPAECHFIGPSHCPADSCAQAGYRSGASRRRTIDLPEAEPLSLPIEDGLRECPHRRKHSDRRRGSSSAV